jgi:uncharacterized protein
VVVDAPPRRRRGPRRLLVVLSVLVLLAAALFVGVAWYYAGEIRSGALAVDRSPRPPSTDTVVESADGGQVVLIRSGEPVDGDPLLRADTDGLVWDGGSGVVSGNPEVRDDGSVVRDLVIVDGSVPADGTEADLRGDVWTDPGGAHGVPYEDVDLPCGPGGDGRCPAWSVPGESDTWMVFVHGKGASRAEGLRALGPAVEVGLPSLLITYRNDPGVPPDPSDSYGYGATEWQDLERAVSHALEEGAAEVVLYGSSMGGAVVAGFLERSDLAHRVSGVVLDAPALDLDATVEHGAARRELPVVGALPGPLTDTAQWIAGWRFDLDWDAVDYLPADWLEVPALVFHGTDDDTVPVSISDELAADRPDLVDLVRVEDTGHVRAWNADPRAYDDRVAAFLECVLDGSSSCDA